MVRPALVAFLLILAAPGLIGQNGGDALQRYFTGREVILKIDMPGTQKGVDLREDKDMPMNWKDYGSRIKQYGAAIRKGDSARVTAVVVKNDRIEFQLDGGGFGTARDDSSTTVTSTALDKSDYEKDLQRRLNNTTDPDERRRLQRDLDRERSRRERQDASNRDAAMVASQIKSQQVAENRIRGGSRFNLRWSGAIPASQLTPDAVMQALADYISFSPQGGPAAQDAQQQDAAAPPSAPGSPTAQLRRGMDMNAVAGLLGQGKQVSESVSNDGLKTQVFDYATGERHIQVTYVDGLVIRYIISSQ